jgi:hypothetical protein
MPEQPHWYERTLDMPPQDPWADQPTTPGLPPHPAPQAGPPSPPPADSAFIRGRAQVSPQQASARYAEHEPTGTGWPGAEAPSSRPPISWRWSDLRRGGEWTSAAVLFAFVGWGVSVLSNGGSLSGQLLVFVITLAVAVGVFCLARLVGHLVLERWLGRTRRGARGSHLITALFLAGVGVADLQSVSWVVDVWNWIVGLANG